MKSTDVKMEKSNAILKYRILQQLMKLLQFVEMFVISVTISRFLSQIPSAVNLSADYFRGISFTVFGHKHMFVIGNLIILILFFKSRTDETGDGNADLCYEYVKSYDMSVVSYTTSASVVDSGNKRKICRSKSENRMKVKGIESGTHRELRRSVTELSRSNNFGGGDKLSGDEFRQTVEAFIANKKKLLRDEEFSPMVYIGS